MQISKNWAVLGCGGYRQNARIPEHSNLYVPNGCICIRLADVNSRRDSAASNVHPGTAQCYNIFITTLRQIPFTDLIGLVYFLHLLRSWNVFCPSFTKLRKVKRKLSRKSTVHGLFGQTVVIFSHRAKYQPPRSNACARAVCVEEELFSLSFCRAPYHEQVVIRSRSVERSTGCVRCCPLSLRVKPVVAREACRHVKPVGTWWHLFSQIGPARSPTTLLLMLAV